MIESQLEKLRKEITQHKNHHAGKADEKNDPV
jgi:hypothetical protein